MNDEELGFTKLDTEYTALRLQSSLQLLCFFHYTGLQQILPTNHLRLLVSPNPLILISPPLVSILHLRSFHGHYLQNMPFIFSASSFQSDISSH